MTTDDRLSQEAAEVLKEIIDNLDDDNHPIEGYWERRFNEISVAEQLTIFGCFDELQENKYLSYLKADDYPYAIILTSKGLHYFDSKVINNRGMGIGAVLRTIFNDYMIKKLLTK